MAPVLRIIIPEVNGSVKAQVKINLIEQKLSAQIKQPIGNGEI